MPQLKQYTFSSGTQNALAFLFRLLLTLVFAMLILRLFMSGMLAPLALSRTTASETLSVKCKEFKPTIPDVRLEFSELLPSGSSARLAYRDRSCGGPGSSPAVSQDVCRVAAFIRTSERSGVHFEAWLPQGWNGRFIATGNGGIGGCLDYNGLSYTVGHGFAAVASNNGHNGTSGKAFHGNPEVVADFAGRSLHAITVTGKEIVKQFYGRPHSTSYYIGCSQGGRQGIGAAEKHPEDFDGIVAGAPALAFNDLISWRASFFPITGPSSSPDFITPAMWTGLIRDEVLRQCDTIDGVKDGIIEHPDACHFRPEILHCAVPGAQNCLTAQQVNRVRQIFSPLRYKDRTVIYPGMQPGSELRAIDRLYAGKPFSDSQDWFRYVVYSDPTWDPANFKPDKDAAASRGRNPFNIQTYPSQLDRFQGAGGKIITYHGSQDQQITSFITAKWYDSLLAGGRTAADLDQFIRFFRISGMDHCGGGPGAWMIGQSAGKAPFDARQNVLAAIVEWVEHGNGPDTIEGTKYIQDSATLGVSFTRRHCRYPKRNKYIGRALPHDTIAMTQAEDWTCV